MRACSKVRASMTDDFWGFSCYAGFRNKIFSDFSPMNE